MKHKPYENWILDEATLTSQQEKILAEHLTICTECRMLQAGWLASNKLLENPVMKAPAPGFSARWQEIYQKKCRDEKVRRYRLTLCGLLILAFTASLTYLVTSGSFLHLFANFFNIISRLVFGITNSLSTFGYWIRSLPAFVPISAGFIIFGLLNAFFIAGLFTLWNLKNRKVWVYEAAVD